MGQREHRAVVRVRLLCSEIEGTVRLSVQWDRGNTGLYSESDILCNETEGTQDCSQSQTLFAMRQREHRTVLRVRHSLQ